MNGWHSHVVLILTDLTGDSAESEKSYRQVFARDESVMRLLIVELALRAFQLEHGTYPTSLTELVPGYLPSVPSDPCDASAQPFHYTRNVDEYVLYGVGQNGTPDNGTPPQTGVTEDDFFATGDLLLSAYFDDQGNNSSNQSDASDIGVE
ncbi:MAG: hypothetical protein R3C10_02165 [Pirellulales bacterium]